MRRSAELRAPLRRTGFSRFPIATPTALVGYVHVKDLLDALPSCATSLSNRAGSAHCPSSPPMTLWEGGAALERSGAHWARSLPPTADQNLSAWRAGRAEGRAEQLVGEVRDATGAPARPTPSHPGATTSGRPGSPRRMSVQGGCGSDDGAIGRADLKVALASAQLVDAARRAGRRSLGRLGAVLDAVAFPSRLRPPSIARARDGRTTCETSDTGCRTPFRRSRDRGRRRSLLTAARPLLGLRRRPTSRAGATAAPLGAPPRAGRPLRGLVHSVTRRPCHRHRFHPGPGGRRDGRAAPSTAPRPAAGPRRGPPSLDAPPRRPASSAPRSPLPSSGVQPTMRTDPRSTRTSTPCWSASTSRSLTYPAGERRARPSPPSTPCSSAAATTRPTSCRGYRGPHGPVPQGERSWDVESSDIDLLAMHRRHRAAGPRPARRLLARSTVRRLWPRAVRDTVVRTVRAS